VDFLILGSFEVRRDGEPVPLGGAKARALLAMLVLHAGEPVSAERLAIALWGEEASATAVNAVQVHVSRVRRALAADGLLVTTGAGYRLDTNRVDALRFEDSYAAGLAALRTGDAAGAARELRAALGLWRGDALADFAGEAFAQGEIARLEELRQAALEARVDADLALGRHRELVAELERRVTAHPLRERTHAQLMLALARSGRQADALAGYRRARDVLVQELGIEPSAELRELERRVLAQEIETAAPNSRIARPPTPTIGRETDLARLRELLSRQRLVTVVGPGGVGKTRLAVEAARGVSDAELVSLAAVAAAQDVASAIVGALDVQLRSGEPPDAALVRRLSADRKLLVLDNFEHVLDAAPLVTLLLDAAPGLTVLVTSREPLRLRAERVMRLEPLSPKAAVRQFTTLLELRDHSLADLDTDAAEEVCRRLDGLPLAIELAAGRVGLLSVTELARRLRVNLSALGPGARDAPPRQRTLAATLEWSYDLARPEEQAALCALAVFSGGATLEAAEAVTGVSLEVLDALVAKNLAIARGNRILLLETVRDFARSRLADPDVDRRHADHFAALAERAAPELRRTSSTALMETLDTEVDNLRAALRWALAHAEPVLALRLASALSSYWTMRNLQVEGQRWLAEGLELAGEQVPDALRAKALAAYASHLFIEESAEGAEAALRESLDLYRALGDTAGYANSLQVLASLRLWFHRVDEAYTLACEVERLAVESGAEETRIESLQTQAMMAPTLELALEIGDRVLTARREAGNLRMYAQVMASLGYTALFHDDPATARRLSEQALEVVPPTDAFGTALAEGNAGLAALLQGDVERARAAFTRGLRIAREHQHAEVFSEALYGLGAVAALDGDDLLAAELRGVSEQAGAAGMDPVIQARMDARFFAPVRARLGEQEWHAAARRLDRERAVDRALGRSSDQTGTRPALDPARAVD
jgi:predicted ATPase/DNA-binding SARP family transcriptional activator